MTVKEPSVAGEFYSNDTNELLAQMKYFESINKNTYQYKTRAVIVPHAGLVYSGRLSYEGISQIDKNIRNIFIFGPSHRASFDGIAVSSFDAWSTPLGQISVNQTVCEELKNAFGANVNDNAMQPEHSIEIEVLFVQYLFQNVKIIPVLVGDENSNKIKEIIEHYYNNTENAFIISSDLSHFFTDKQAQQIDRKTAQMIEAGDENMQYEQACGLIGIKGLVKFANNNGFSLIRVNLTNSAEVSFDKSSVVGYGVWFLFEGDKNTYIKQYYSEFLFDLCKNTLRATFNRQKTLIEYPKIFDQLGACFITLEKNNYLRGCIGSVVAYRSLIDDITEHTKDAAFNDNRFKPVKKDELSELKYSISILSTPTKISFKDEADLLDKIVPYKDGIIIKDKKYSGVYLPCVWEQLPDKKEFLNSLKVKAGLSADYFSNTFEAYRFETTYIKEE